MDKFEVIKTIIQKVDAMVDMRGIEKCVTAVNIINLLNALSKGLGEEDESHKAEKKLLEDQLRVRAEPEPGGETVGGETYTLNLEEDDPQWREE